LPREARTHRGERDIAVDHPECRLDHVTALIHFSDDPVSAMRPVCRDGDPGPFDGLVPAGDIGQYVAVSSPVLAGDDDAGLVGIVSRSDGRIDRDDDPRELRHGDDARGLDDAVVPQGPRYIFKQFGV
jgi:hypothetical protein